MNIMEEGNTYGKMDYEEFKQYVRDNIENIVGDDYDTSIKCVIKNNGVRLYGLSVIKKGESVSPTIYLERYYENYMEGDDISDIIGDIYDSWDSTKTNIPVSQCLAEFGNYNLMKEKIVYKIVNYELNQELLKDVPHRRMLDLVVVYYFVVGEDEKGKATAIIHNSHMELWNIDEDELYREAHKNTSRLMPSEINTMEDILCEIMGDNMESIGLEDMSSSNMYVLSNTDRINGASCILYNGLLRKLSEKLDDNLYILPSSIHEVIIIPMSKASGIAELRSMVRDVNREEVSYTEMLSDNVYVYDRYTDEISM